MPSKNFTNPVKPKKNFLVVLGVIIHSLFETKKKENGGGGKKIIVH